MCLNAKYPAPKEVGGVWPFRDGTAMRRAFREIYAADGLTPKAFANLFRKADEKDGIKAGPLFGANHDFMLKVMRSGANRSPWHGGSVLTHTWRFSEEGGRYRIYDVKYVAKKADTAKKSRR